MSATAKSVILNPTQWIFEIPDTIHQSALQISQTTDRSISAWNRYLAEVTSQVLVAALQEDGEDITRNAADIDRFTQLNQWIAGTPINWAGKRCIVLPQTSLDESEVLIPQEWIDIPDWQGDYFLAAQVDTDERSLTVLGYATHQRVKQLADYAASDRTYHLDAAYLIQDLNTLAVARQLCPDETTLADIAPIPVLAETAVNQWLTQLRTSLNPRLAVPFQTWAGLITQPNALAQLTQQTSPITSAIASTLTTLSQWFEGAVEQGWQTVDSLMGSSLAPAYAFRDAAQNESAILRRVKVIQMGQEATFLLLLEVESLEDDRLSIKMRLYPSGAEQTLPPDITLTLQTTEGETVQTVSSREQDDLIQLKRFRCPYGFEFIVQITQGDTTIDVPFAV